VIGMLGPYRPRPVHAHEERRAGELRTLRDQRFDERLRLGAGLPE
jgi:hypothetical protein